MLAFLPDVLRLDAPKHHMANTGYLMNTLEISKVSAATDFFVSRADTFNATDHHDFLCTAMLAGIADSHQHVRR